MKQTFIFLVILQLSFGIFAQVAEKNNFGISNIPETLKKNATAVVRYRSDDIEIISNTSVVHKVKYILTVLKRSGKKYAHLSLYYDKFSKIKSISGKVYDKNGRQITRIEKKQIHDFSVFDGFSLYSDNRMKYISEPEIDPPYTVVYEYEIHLKSLLFFPVWAAIPDFNVSLQDAELKINDNSNSAYRFLEKNINSEIDEEQNTKIWKLKNVKATEQEPFNKDLTDYLPIVYIAPNNFELEGYKGNAASWENFGKWIFQLNKDRNTLSEETKNKIIELTKNAKNDREKTQILYEYMQNKTRYVSIQLGIGGWQPFESGETDRNGYGDCKALSFYMQSILNTVGIKSLYTLVYAGKNAREMRNNFPSNQFNHAILCVPLKSDTVWLECTSQIMPFGYIGSFTDDRDVLLIDEKGGKIAHTKVYKKRENSKICISKVNIDEDGNALANVKTTYSGIQYDNVLKMFELSLEDKERRLQTKINLSNIKFEDISYENHRAVIPSADENLKFEVKNFAAVTGKRLFLPVTFMNKLEYIPPKIENRKTRIKNKRGFTNSDSIYFSLPDGYKSEFIPPKTEIMSDFGKYYFEAKLKGNILYCIRKIEFNKFNFPKEKYNELRDFLAKVYETDSQKAVLVK